MKTPTGMTKYGDTITKYGVNTEGAEAEKTAEEACPAPEECRVCHQKVAGATEHVCPEALV
jgi:hypothetical protein